MANMFLGETVTAAPGEPKPITVALPVFAPSPQGVALPDTSQDQVVEIDAEEEEPAPYFAVQEAAALGPEEAATYHHMTPTPGLTEEEKEDIEEAGLTVPEPELTATPYAYPEPETLEKIYKAGEAIRRGVPVRSAKDYVIPVAAGAGLFFLLQGVIQ